MRATAEPLEGNKVRLSVEVEEAEVDEAVNSLVRSLTQRASIPGFRPGKVPRRVLEARMGGRQALRGEAIRESLPDFYAHAVVDAEVDPITQPEIEMTSGDEDRGVAFDALVEIRPTVGIPGYAGLVVTVPAPEVPESEVDAQVDRLRETDAELEEVSRPAIDGDNVTIDIQGREGAEEVPGANDLLYEVGSGSLVPGLDEQLRGAKAGDVLAVDSEGAGGRRASFRVLVKKVQRKVLPELTDEWVAENSESETVDDLRADLRRRLTEMRRMQVQMQLREGSVAALAELVDDEEVPAALVDQEAGQRLQDLEERLSARGASIEQLMAATGQSAEDFLGEVRTEATGAVKADLGLRALAAAEDLEVTDDELDAEIASTATRLEMDADELRRRLDHNGRTGAVRSEQLKGKALTWLIDHVGVVDEEGQTVDRAALELAPGGEAEADDQATGDEIDSAPDGDTGAPAAGGDRHDEAEVEAGRETSSGRADHGTVAVAENAGPGSTEEGS